MKECFKEIVTKPDYSSIKLLEAIKKYGKKHQNFKVLSQRDLLRHTSFKTVEKLRESLDMLILKGQVKETKSGNRTLFSILEG